MKINDFLIEIDKKNNDYPIAKEFIASGKGDSNYSGHTFIELERMSTTNGNHGEGKSGSNEKEHVIAYFTYDYKNGRISKYTGNKTVEEIYQNGKYGTTVRCKEFYICFAELAGVDSKTIIDAIKNAEPYLKDEYKWHEKFKEKVSWKVIEEALYR